MRKFRSDYLSDWKIKVIDLVGHVLWSLTLTFWFYHKFTFWHLIWQWTPDMYLPFKWLYGMITNKYPSKNNIFVEAHRSLHSWMGLILYPVFFMLLNQTAFGFFVTAQYLTHWAWDKVTHRNLPEYAR